MYHTASAYSRAIRADERKIVPYISLGVGFDPTAADDLISISCDSLPMSNPAQMIDANYALTQGLATFEGDGIPTAPGSGMIAPPIQAEEYPPETGLWSHDISDSDGAIDWIVTLTLSRAHTSAFSVYADSVVHIVSGEIRYYLEGVPVRTMTIDATSSVIRDPQITTYDAIEVEITGIDKPYHHVRIAEFEFGASVTLSNTVLGPSMSLLGEIDILGLSMPISQLDFSILNVEGEYDQDNPDSLLPTVAKWSPLTLALTIITDEGQTSIPMGRFYITERKGADVLLNVTAQDARSILQTTYTPLSLIKTESLGEMYERILSDLRIPHVIDPDVYNIYPEADITLDDEELDLLTQLLYVQQYYGVYIAPGRDENLHITKNATGDAVQSITASNIIEYPNPETERTYNYISVSYGQNKIYSVDLRTDDKEGKSELTLVNPLILTEDGASRIARELSDKLYSQLYSAQAFGDASLDPGDTVPIEGRWTQGNSDSFRITSIDWTYDGSFLMTVKGVKQ